MNDNRTWRWAIVCCVAATAVALWSAGPRPAEAQRAAQTDKCCIAVLHLNGVLEVLEERKVREKELTDFINQQQKKLEDMRRLGQQAQDDLKILPERSRDWESKREEVVRLAMRLRGEEELAKALVEDKRKKMSLDLFRKIREAASQYGQREGFAIVLSSDSDVDIPIDAPEQQVQAAMVGRRVLYRADATDISAAVAQMMNTEFKAR